MKTDTAEKGLETLIMRHMTGSDGLTSGAPGVVAEAACATGGSGWLAGNDSAYDREFAVDSEQLFTFLIATQPEEWTKLGIANYNDKQGMARQKFLARLQGEIPKTLPPRPSPRRRRIEREAEEFQYFLGPVVDGAFR